MIILPVEVALGEEVVMGEVAMEAEERINTTGATTEKVREEQFL